MDHGIVWWPWPYASSLKQQVCEQLPVIYSRKIWKMKRCLYQNQRRPKRFKTRKRQHMRENQTIITLLKLTYPTLGRGKSLQKWQNVRDVLGPCNLQRVYIIFMVWYEYTTTCRIPISACRILTCFCVRFVCFGCGFSGAEGWLEMPGTQWMDYRSYIGGALSKTGGIPPPKKKRIIGCLTRTYTYVAFIIWYGHPTYCCLGIPFFLG